MDTLDHGCTRDMNVMNLASMDTLDHGRTRDVNVFILASMDALDHGRTRDMSVIIWPAWMLSVMDALETWMQKKKLSCSAAHRNTVNYRLKSVFAT